MKLFEVEDGMVKMNVPWIKLIPEFKALFSRRTTKVRYEENVLGRRRLAYIYFTLDFSSPIADWEDGKKQDEALSYVELTKEDINTPLMKAALEKYGLLQHEKCRPLKTYRAALRGLEAMDRYLETVDFTALDKQGKLLYTPNQFTTNMSTINKAYDELNKLRTRIEEELSQSSAIRGAATMGDREMKPKTEAVEWEESMPENEGEANWLEMGAIINSTNQE